MHSHTGATQPRRCVRSSPAGAVLQPHRCCAPAPQVRALQPHRCAPLCPAAYRVRSGSTSFSPAKQQPTGGLDGARAFQRLDFLSFELWLSSSPELRSDPVGSLFPCTCGRFLPLCRAAAAEAATAPPASQGSQVPLPPATAPGPAGSRRAWPAPLTSRACSLSLSSSLLLISTFETCVLNTELSTQARRRAPSPRCRTLSRGGGIAVTQRVVTGTQRGTPYQSGLGQ